MSTHFSPNEQYLTIHWSDLEIAWRMLASPEKADRIEDTLKALRTVSRTQGSEKAVFTMVAASAWLTDDAVGSDDG